LRTPQAKSSQDPLVYSTNKHTPVLPSEANPGKTTRPYPKTKAERAGGMAQVQALPSTAKRKKKSICEQIIQGKLPYTTGVLWLGIGLYRAWKLFPAPQQSKVRNASFTWLQENKADLTSLTSLFFFFFVVLLHHLSHAPVILLLACFFLFFPDRVLHFYLEQPQTMILLLSASNTTATLGLQACTCTPSLLSFLSEPMQVCMNFFPFLLVYINYTW
jgi:hypothetical protein